LCRGLLIAVAPELFVAGNLIRVQQRPRFEMCREMHGAQATLKLGNGGRRHREVRRDLAFGEESWSRACPCAISWPPSGLATALMRSKIACTSRRCVSVSSSCPTRSNTCFGPGSPFSSAAFAIPIPSPSRRAAMSSQIAPSPRAFVARHRACRHVAAYIIKDRASQEAYLARRKPFDKLIRHTRNTIRNKRLA